MDGSHSRRLAPWGARVCKKHTRLLSGLTTLAILTLHSGETKAQQSLFNVPSGKITPTKGLFFQEQLNLNASGESNLTSDLGLGKGFELGLNILHVHLYNSPDLAAQHDPSPDSFTANLQWAGALSDWLSVAVGTQHGVSAPTKNLDYVGWGFGVMRFEPKEGRYGGYVIGGYYGTRTWTGIGPHGGGLVGFELPLYGEYVALCADWMVGTNASSVEVIGLQLMPMPTWDWQISLGAQLPGLFTDTGWGFVLELTHLGGAFKEDSDPRKFPKPKATARR